MASTRLAIASFSALPGATRGILWMCGASLLYATTYLTVRHLSLTFSALELVFFRVLLALVAMLPWLIRAGIRSLHTNRWRLYLVRTLVTYAGMVTWFYALGHLPMANAAALMFTIPLFTVVIAALGLRERTPLSRWIATLTGFAGALIVIRPGFADVSVAMFAVLFTAVAYSIANITTKMLADTEDNNAAVFYMFALMVPVAGGPAAIFWVTPGWVDVPWILALGLLTALSFQCFTRSLSAAPTGVVMPFYYLQLPFVAVIGFIVYAEVPEIWVWLGGGVICASGYYIARREHIDRRTA